MSQYGPRPFNSDGTLVEYSDDGSTWNFIPGVGDVTSSGGEPPSTDVNTFNESFRAYGRATPESITMTIPGVQPSHNSYTDLREALEMGSELFFRWRYPDEEVLFGPSVDATISINTSGVLAADTTGSGTDASHVDLTTPGIGPGAAFKIGTNTTYWVIKSFTPSSHATTPRKLTIQSVDLTNDNPSATIVAATYSVVIPPIYQPQFKARVTSFTVTRSAGASASGSLSLGLLSLLPAEKVGTP